MPISLPILAPRERHFMSPTSAHTHSHVCAAIDFHFPPRVFVTRHHHRPHGRTRVSHLSISRCLIIIFFLVLFIITGTFIKGRHQLRGGKTKNKLGTCTTAHRCATPCLPFFSSKGGAKFIPTLYLSLSTPPVVFI